MRLVAAVALLSICLTTACSPGPTATPKTKSPSPSAAATPSAANRAVLGKGKFSAASSVPALLIRLPGEDQLRALTWDLSASGFTGATVGQSPFFQSPDGRFYATRDTIYDRTGAVVGPVPWLDKGFSATWSSGGNLCKIQPLIETTGSGIVLQTAVPGKPAHTVGRAFGIYGDNATYPVLVCNEDKDVAIAASMGQGVALSSLWVIKLSTGQVVRTYDYRQTNAVAHASRDGSLLAESTVASGSTCTTTIGKPMEGTKLATINDFCAHGFSSDSTLLVGSRKSKTVVLDWNTGKEIWSIPDQAYGGMVAEPGGRRVAVGLGFIGGSDRRDVYIVSPDGSAARLPDEVWITLGY